MEELLSLKWNNHRSTFLHRITVLRDKPQYSDATLACEGRFYSAHKLVLSTCSDYFSAMFDRTASCKNPIIVLKDVKCEDLEALLDYMYLGEVNVRQADLASLIKAAECLRVKGLAVPDDEPPKKGSHSDSNVRRHDGASSPPAKRKRRSEDQDGRDDVRPSSTQKLKSPQSHSRLSPTPQDSQPDSGEPLSSPSHQQSSSSAHGDSISKTPFVKVEMEDNSGIEIDDNYIPNDGYKEEPDNSGDMSNDLPEFLQQDSISHSQESSNYSHGAFPGTSSFQPGDLPGWQGEGSNASFPSHMNFGTSSDSSQNAPGGLFLFPELLSLTMEASIKELYAKRLYEKYEQSKKYLIPKSEYIKAIAELKQAHLEKSTKSKQLHYLLRKYEVFPDMDEEKLIRKRKSIEEAPIFYVSIEDTYDIIKQAHLATKHGGRDRMIKCLSKVYANIPTWAVEIFKSYCLVCQRKKQFLAGISANNDCQI